LQSQLSHFDLAPNQTITVVIGDDRLFDAFRVRSDLGATRSCATRFGCSVAERMKRLLVTQPGGATRSPPRLCPCNPGRNCTHTQGYSMNHPDVWLLQNLTLGTVSYGESPLLQILNQQRKATALLSWRTS